MDYLAAMKYIFTFLLLAGFFAVRAQKSVKLEEIGNHVGDSVVLTGKVYSTRYFETAKDAPTLLNLGAPFPDQLLTVVIYGAYRNQFKEAPETLFKDKTVQVTGKVELYKGKPQIAVQQLPQLTVIEKE